MKFKDAKEIATYIEEMHGDLFMVGGAVRDKYMELAPSDIDYVITGVAISDLHFDRVVGADFPVFLIEIGDDRCEVAMARKERKVGVGYHGFESFTNKEITIEEDLIRRDFTMNAMAEHALTSEFIDPYNGRKDIDERRIRATSDAFREDPLRVYRAARFSAKFGFFIEPTTLYMMRSMKEELNELSVERVWKEVEKVLDTDQPSLFFKYLSAASVLDVHFPEIEALDIPDMHDGTSFNHTMVVMDHGTSAMLRWGLLVHDLGKGVTPAEDHPHHFGHDKLGVAQIELLCERLKIPNKFRDFGILCAKNHMKFKNADEMRAGKFLRWITGMKDNLGMLIAVSCMDSIFREGGNVKDWDSDFEPVSAKIKKVHRAVKEITGVTLIEEGFEPGPKFGEALFQKRVSRYRQFLKK